MEEKIFLVWLHSLWFTHKNLNEIFSWCENYKEIYENFNRDFLKSFKFSDKKINDALQKRDKIDLYEIEKYIEDKDISIVSKHDFDFPEQLLDISNPPYFLYIRGNLSNIWDWIWVVWSRKISTYWQKAIENIVPDLANHFSIISWWALWCDTFAHKQALISWWKTVVCVWTWIDKIYPSWNKNLYEEIIANGWVLVSIFPFWTNWNKFTFPVRNEIIVWLSKWILVVEAQEKSWSLITARLCLENNRDLFAVPWEITKSQSSWTNALIKVKKAKMVIDSSDILDEYWFWMSKKWKIKKPEFTEEIDEDIFDLLLIEPMISDDIASKLKKTISEISLRLSMLELTWLINKNVMWKYEVK